MSTAWAEQAMDSAPQYSGGAVGGTWHPIGESVAKFRYDSKHYSDGHPGVWRHCQWRAE